MACGMKGLPKEKGMGTGQVWLWLVFIFGLPVAALVMSAPGIAFGGLLLLLFVIGVGALIIDGIKWVLGKS